MISEFENANIDKLFQKAIFFVESENFTKIQASLNKQLA